MFKEGCNSTIEAPLDSSAKLHINHTASYGFTKINLYFLADFMLKFSKTWVSILFILRRYAAVWVYFSHSVFWAGGAHSSPGLKLVGPSLSSS